MAKRQAADGRFLRAFLRFLLRASWPGVAILRDRSEARIDRLLGRAWSRLEGLPALGSGDWSRSDQSGARSLQSIRATWQLSHGVLDGASPRLEGGPIPIRVSIPRGRVEPVPLDGIVSEAYFFGLMDTGGDMGGGARPTPEVWRASLARLQDALFHRISAVQVLLSDPELRRLVRQCHHCKRWLLLRKPRPRPQRRIFCSPALSDAMGRPIPRRCLPAWERTKEGRQKSAARVSQSSKIATQRRRRSIEDLRGAARAELARRSGGGTGKRSRIRPPKT